MEHDDRDDKDFADILKGVDEPERDFESFLKEKDKEWKADPIVSELREIPVADDAVGNFSSGTNSPRTPETSEPGESTPAGDAAERATKLALHSHPVAGRYVTETTEPVRIDPEWVDVFNKTVQHPEKSREILIEDVIKKTFTTQFSVEKATPEQIIEHYHSLDRCIYLIKAHQNGIRTTLEDMLRTETHQRRVELLELDRKHRVKTAKKAVDSIREKRTKPSKATGKSKAHKMIDTLKGLAMDRPTIEQNLTAVGLLDDSSKAYLDKLFG
jgi:hypothetical protein